MVAFDCSFLTQENEDTVPILTCRDNIHGQIVRWPVDTRIVKEKNYRYTSWLHFTNPSRLKKYRYMTAVIQRQQLRVNRAVSDWCEDFAQ